MHLARIGIMAAKQDDRINWIRSGFRGSRFGVLAKLNIGKANLNDMTVNLTT
jgi:hypothetical protein